MRESRSSRVGGLVVAAGIGLAAATGHGVAAAEPDQAGSAGTAGNSTDSSPHAGPKAKPRQTSVGKGTVSSGDVASPREKSAKGVARPPGSGGSGHAVAKPSDPSGTDTASATTTAADTATAAAPERSTSALSPKARTTPSPAPTRAIGLATATTATTGTAAFNAMIADERALNVRPWLYRIARNRSLNHLRRVQAIGVDSMDVHLSENGTSAADKVHRREEFRLLVEDVQGLPETQRTALLLREIDALSYDQIAEAMDTTIPSVKSLLVRARVSLAESAEARQLTCDEVRDELGEVAEGLHRMTAPVRRHLRQCDRCSAFRKQLRQTNRALAAVFPVGPLLLLKKSCWRTSARRPARAAAPRPPAPARPPRARARGARCRPASAAVASKAAAGLAAAAIVTAGAVEVDHAAQRRPPSRHQRSPRLDAGRRRPSSPPRRHRAVRSPPRRSRPRPSTRGRPRRPPRSRPRQGRSKRDGAPAKTASTPRRARHPGAATAQPDRRLDRRCRPTRTGIAQTGGGSLTPPPPAAGAAAARCWPRSRRRRSRPRRRPTHAAARADRDRDAAHRRRRPTATPTPSTTPTPRRRRRRPRRRDADAVRRDDQGVP